MDIINNKYLQIDNRAKQRRRNNYSLNLESEKFFMKIDKQATSQSPYREDYKEKKKEN